MIWDYWTIMKRNSNYFLWNITMNTIIAPHNDIEYFVNTLDHRIQDYDPGINDMFLNNLDSTFYAMQMQEPDVLTHAQMKRQVDADKFIDAQHP
jgi:hypothetical protein